MNCGNCANWKHLQDAIGKCQLTGVHTVRGAYCSDWADPKVTLKELRFTSLPQPNIKTDDRRYKKALAFTRANGQVRTTTLRDHLHCTYLEAAQLIEQMKTENFIGAI